MPVDPEIAGVLQLLAAVDQPMHEMTPQQARDSFAALVVGGRPPEHVVPVRSVEDITVPGGDGDLAARVYRPEESGPLPTVVLFHGGGWVIGDLETHDNMARALARDSRAVVVSVDYRLAPEAPFPAAVEDALAATRWAAAHLDDLGGSAVLAVAGDSAGGNLAAVVAQEMRSRDRRAAADLPGHRHARRAPLAHRERHRLLPRDVDDGVVLRALRRPRHRRRRAAVPGAGRRPVRAAPGRGRHRRVRPAARRGRGVRRRAGRRRHAASRPAASTG